VALDKRRGVKIRDAWMEKCESFEQLERSFAGDPRRDYDPPSAIVEFDFPATSRTATSNLRDIDWNFVTTFAFDASDERQADTDWLMLAVELLNAQLDDPHLGTTFVQRWRIEDELVPESLQAHAMSKPLVLKTVRFIAETEEF
jgi:hypothetical protein